MKNVFAFAGHMLSGACYFIVFATIAVAIQRFAELIEIDKMSGPLLYGLLGGEYLLFLLDLGLFTGFILNSFKKSITELWKN